MRIKVRFDKLVRDKIVDQNLEIGGSVDFEKLEGRELEESLLHKLVYEEVPEIAESDGLEEIADGIDILYDLAAVRGFSRAELDAAAHAKRQERGGFLLGHFVYTVEVPIDSKLGRLYASDPDKFPEVKDE